MPKPSPITIPADPVGTIPRSADLIERVAKAENKDPKAEAPE